MNRVYKVAAEIGLASALVAGCSSSGGESTPSAPDLIITSPSQFPSSSPNLGPVLPSASDSLTSSASAPACKATTNEMYLLNSATEDANKELAVVQGRIGIVATKSLVALPDFNLTVNGQVMHVKMRIPQDPHARCQVIDYTANSKNAGTEFKSLGYDALSDTTVSATAYSLVQKDGKLIMSGTSVSVVGQETDGAGLFQNIATERCQGLELDTPTTDPKLYDAEKEAVCNSQGIATDVILASQTTSTYDDYLSRMKDYKVLGPDVNQTGSTIAYPLLSKTQFDTLHSSLVAAALAKA